MLRFPVWVRAAVVGVGYGAFMFAFDARPGPDGWFPVLVWVGGAVVFALVMAATTRRRERRVFQAGGQPLTGAERVAVVHAVAHAEPPSDPRVREAARGYADRLLRPGNSVAAIASMGAVFTVLSVVLVLGGQPRAWLLVVGWLVLGAVLVGRTRRQRTAARAFLSRVGDAAPVATPASRA